MSECRTVYLVDDDDDLRLAIGTTLTMAGYAVRDFDSAEAFLDVVDAEIGGCLVTDLRLPGISGVMLQQQLAERQIMLPVIIITGYGEVRESVRAMKAGAIDFIEKPVSPADLLAQVAVALELDAARRQQRERQARFHQLSPREQAVVTQVVAGHSNKQIAQALQISFRTVEKYRASAMLRLGVGNVAELTRYMHALSP